MLPNLSRIDQLSVGDHTYLSLNDDVYFFGEYTAGKRYDHSPTNQLIVNLKHGVEHKGSPRWKHKLSAIDRVAASLAHQMSDSFVASATFVPIPPSVVRTDPSYDGRCMDILNRFRQMKRAADVRELIYQTENTRKSHSSDARLTVDELLAVYRIDESLCAPPPQRVVLLDDVLTTGTHFIAARQAIRTKFGAEIKVFGIMVARRKPEPIDLSRLFGPDC